MNAARSHTVAEKGFDVLHTGPGGNATRRPLTPAEDETFAMWKATAVVWALGIALLVASASMPSDVLAVVAKVLG